MTWRSIKDDPPPMDGTDFIAYYPAEDGEPEKMDVTSWPQDRIGRYYGLTLGGVDPTHWMPLPEPPA